MPLNPNDNEQDASRGAAQADAADGGQAGAPPGAPAARPGPADALQRFIDFYLKPIAAGGLPADLSQTPLLVAFDLYGVADALRDDGAAGRRLQAALEEAFRGPSRPLDAESLSLAWNDLRELASRVTQERFLKINDWLSEQARRGGIDVADLLPRSPEPGGKDWAHPRSVHEFYRFFNDPRNASARRPDPPPDSQADDRTPPGAPAEESIAGKAWAGPPSGDPAAGGHSDGGPAPAPDTSEATSPDSSPAAIIILLTRAAPPQAAGQPAASEAPAAPAPSPSPAPAPRSLPPPLPPPWSPVTFECPPAYYEAFEPDVLEPLRRDAEAVVDGMAALLDRCQPVGGDPAREQLLGLAFDDARWGPGHQAVAVRTPPGAGEDLWFVGDLHGDLLALNCALRYVADRSRAEGGRPWRVVFLGDLFDDGRYSYEVVLKVFSLILHDPARVCLLAGNHDEGLGYDEAAGRFVSSVNPSDFTDELNARPDDPVRQKLGRLAVRLFRTAPRALFLPDGLLVTHGGVPHADRLDEIRRVGVNALNEPGCLQDFVWTRAAERAKRRIPNRGTRGCEFGYEDFDDFCETAERAVGQPVRRMVRGHDHVENRYALFEKYKKHPALTINTMSSRLPREVFGPYERVPVVAKWKAGRVPEVHRLAIPPEVIRRVYPRAVEAVE